MMPVGLGNRLNGLYHKLKAMPSVEELVDREKLRAFLADRIGEAESFGVERHSQGFSNETLFVTWGDRELVVRPPPTR